VDTSNFKGLDSCCDKHDICYDTCGTLRTKCDNDFEKCMKTICGKNGDCLGISSMLSVRDFCMFLFVVPLIILISF
jgi:hypothetical protein